MSKDDSASPITFVVPGQPQASAAAATSTRGADRAAPAVPAFPGSVKASVRVAALRSAGPPQRLVAVPGEDIVALHIANGPVLYLHPANARDLMLAMAEPSTLRGKAVPGDAVGEVVVQPQLRWRGLEAAAGPAATRGFLGDVVLGAVEVLTGFGKGKLLDGAADFAASQVVQKVDGQVTAALYALAPERLAKLKGTAQPIQTPDPKLAAQAAQGPLLVLIHGTFVETTSTFGKLWAQHPSSVRRLFEHYGGRVFALEHETLGKSPIANALTLVKALPGGARLHLATHSRGGLVAEVLARVAHQQAMGPGDLAFFEDKAFAAHRAELLELAAECKARKVVVERVVRVACPARGTLLAARRLDAYLSVLKWAIEATGVPLVDTFVELIAEVARRRAEPEQIPGLAAMIPDTPLLNWLNSRGQEARPIAGELRVVAGDLEGDSIGSWIKTLLSDAFYWTDNDIVVHTRSMYAGAPRAGGGASFLLDQGGKTTHFAYFSNPRTVDALVDGLIDPKLPAGFETIGPLSWAGQDASGLRGTEQRTGDASKPAVFVLPGILGSNLKAGDKRIWLSLRLIGGLDRLAYRPQGVDGVAPDGAIGLVYDKLIGFLGATHEVTEFSFDWRRPIEDEAARLAQALEAALDARKASGQPVRLIAHSMGGLVARTVQIVAPQTWDRVFAHAGARLVMLGTPNGGSYAPMQVLSGDDTFGNALAAFGSPFADREARSIMAAMPGFLQLQAGVLDPELKLGDHATWKRIATADFERMQRDNWWHRHAGESMEAAYHWGVPEQAVLDRAKTLRAKLDAQRDTALPRFADKLKLVVGQARATPVGFDDDGSEGFVYLDAADGDGRVPLSSALLPGVATWKLDCEHGGLPSEKKAFDAFLDLLATGTTARLPALSALRGDDAPAAAGATMAVTKSRPSRTRKAVRPAASEASVFGLGSGTEFAPAAHGAALEIGMVNGNLSFVGEPLLVGHYIASELTGTEAVVDRLIGGRMSDALKVGLYPEAVGTSQVFVNSWRDPKEPWRLPRPHAAIVVGLGDEGGLRESELVKAVQQAVLAWSQRLAEDPARANATTELASTLVGSGGIGVSPAASARAIARGVRQANVLLAGVGWPVVSRLSFVELYLDRASDAWQGLQILAGASPEAYSLAREIRFGTGPLRRQLQSGYRGAHYDLISAVNPKGDEGTIEFALDSRRARTEVRAVRTQAGLVRDLVRRGATARGDEPTIGRTLFQLLVPVEIEPFLGGNDRMVLDLDERTAAIPWELLDAGEAAAGSDRRPWAVRSQLLRRLRREQARPAPSSALRDARADDSVLVIGEPLVDAGSGYGPLPAAQKEALVVEEQLMTRGGLDYERVTTLAASPDAGTVISALLQRPWRIVHIAGHGESIEETVDAAGRPGLTRGGRGVVLSGGHFLGSHEIGCMRTVPELVFVNCCHLGTLQGAQALGGADLAGFAAGVAVKLIDIGVRCVIACGWAVEDEPAQEFARRFYRELLAGARFIDAVAAAREACWLANPSGKTWAAYQCYGDPGWTWRSRTGDAQAPAARADEFAAIATPVGLTLVLDTMATESRFMGRRAAEQQERLRQLETRFAERWGGVGAVAEAFGVAWEAAEDRAAAIAWLERAVAAGDGSASIKSQETLANLRARQAWQEAESADRHSRGNGAMPRDGDAGLQLALKGLLDLVGRYPSVERWSLVGSAHKRQALIARRKGDPAAEQRALLASRAAYRKAFEMAEATPQADAFWPAINLMALELAMHDGADGADGAPALDLREATERRLVAKSRTDPTFFSEVTAIELDQIVALAEGRLAQTADTLASRYADLHERIDSTNYWGSVADQADLLLTRHAARGSKAEREAAAKLHARLQRYAGR